MELRKVLTLRGPNIWVTFPVLEAWIDLTENDLAAATVPAVRNRLVQFCEQLHGVAGGANDEAIASLRNETSLPRMIARLTAELQNALGCAKVSYMTTAVGNEPGLNKIVVAYAQDRFGRECVETTVAFFQAVLAGAEFDTTATISSLQAYAAKTAPAATRAAILAAAIAKGIPAVQLPVDGVWQLGWGAKQRRLAGAQTDRSNAIGGAIVGGDRDDVQAVLRAVGVPTVDFDDTVPFANYRLLSIGQHFVAAVRVDEATGKVEDVTNLVHEDTTIHAIEASRMIGQDVLVLNVVAKDIAQPLSDENGAALDVSTESNLDVFCAASPEIAKRVGGAIVESLFPGNQNGRIPIATITGVNGKTTTTRLVAHIMAATGRRVGMTCTDGIYIAGRRIDHDDCSGPKSARNVLMNPSVDAAVLETARGGILREGMAVDRCDVAVVMNIGEGDHLGLNDINTVEQLAVVKRTIVTAVGQTGSAVLKADDPLTAAMASHCPGSIVFFCMNAEHPVIVKHRETGGRAVFVRDNAIVLAEGTLEIPLLTLDRIPLTHNGRIWFQVENAMAATAAHWSLGTPAEVIRVGLESFDASIDKSPGRFNLLEMNGATVVVDYGHNTSSLKAMLDTLKQFPHQRRYAVYSAAGDRRDCDMVRQGELLGEAFDRVFFYEDHYMRGREPGEIIGLFSQGALKGGRLTAENIIAIRGWEDAAEQALKAAQPGDLLLLQADTIDAAVTLIRRHLVVDAAAQEVSLNAAFQATNSATG